MTEIADGTYTAVVDRFEGDLAVLVVDGEDGPAGELVVEVTALPENGQHTDAVLSVTLADGELTVVTNQPDEAEERAESAQNRFDRLSRRPGNDEREK